MTRSLDQICTEEKLSISPAGVRTPDATLTRQGLFLAINRLGDDESGAPFGLLWFCFVGFGGLGVWAVADPNRWWIGGFAIISSVLAGFALLMKWLSRRARFKVPSDVASYRLVSRSGDGFEVLFSSADRLEVEIVRSEIEHQLGLAALKEE